MQDKPFSALKMVVSLLIIALLFAYPFLIYQYIDLASPRWFALILLLVFTLRFLLFLKSKTFIDYAVLLIVSTFCVSIALVDNEKGLRFYPVLMNMTIGMSFIVSLWGQQSLVERFANMAKKKPPPEARSYLRTLTLLWGILLIINGIVSAYTAWYTSLSFWALYNGILAYLFMALFALGEFVYRGFYKRKNGIVDD